MRNGETMNLKMTRIDICDLMIATSSVYISMRTELEDEKTTEPRKKVLRESIKKWERLHDEIRQQIDAFDREYDENQEVANA